MRAYGLLDKWKMTYWPKLPGCAKDMSPKAIAMSDLQGVFFMSLTLTIFAATILLIERFVNKFRHLFTITRRKYSLFEGNNPRPMEKPQPATYHKTMESPTVASHLQIARKSIIDLANNVDANRKLQRRRKSYGINDIINNRVHSIVT